MCTLSSMKIALRLMVDATPWTANNQPFLVTFFLHTFNDKQTFSSKQAVINFYCFVSIKDVMNMSFLKIAASTISGSKFCCVCICVEYCYCLWIHNFTLHDHCSNIIEFSMSFMFVYMFSSYILCTGKYNVLKCVIQLTYGLRT